MIAFYLCLMLTGIFSLIVYYNTADIPNDIYLVVFWILTPLGLVNLFNLFVTLV